MSSTIQAWKSLKSAGRNIKAANIKKLYLKNGLLAIHKPYGIAVHGGPKVKTSIVNLLAELEIKHKLPSGSLQLVHRLDKNTSGVLMLTYTNEMYNQIKDMYKNREIEKKYLAILLGSMGRVSGHVKGDLYERKMSNGQFKQAVDVESIEQSQAVTSYSILDNSKRTCMLCEFTMYTGYKHQIRVHAYELMNAPVLGDHQYHDDIGPQTLPLRLMQMLKMQGVHNADTGKNHIRPWQRGLLPMHLVATHVRLPQLENNKDVIIESPIPEYFEKTMNACDLVLDRDHVDSVLRNKQRKLIAYLNRANTVSRFTSKGLSKTRQETSL